MANTLIPINDMQLMAESVAKSRLFGMKTADEAMSIMLLCQAEGFHPGIAVRDYHVIQGRPALKADAMLARFQAAGGKVNWDVYTDEEVKATFSHPSGGSLTLSWTFEQASKIGLTKKDNWRNYPRAMLRARVISEGIRTIYPGCVVGVYTPEEVQDFNDKPRQEKDITPPSEEPPVIDEAPVVIDATEQWPLTLPGQQATMYDTQDEWVAALYQVCEKLGNSKLTVTVKDTKLEMLKKANLGVLRKIGIEGSADIYRNMSKLVAGAKEASSEEKKQTQEWANEFQQEMDK
jgi:hypothetical protein